MAALIGILVVAGSVVSQLRSHHSWFFWSELPGNETERKQTFDSREGDGGKESENLPSLMKEKDSEGRFNREVPVGDGGKKSDKDKDVEPDPQPKTDPISKEKSGSPPNSWRESDYRKSFEKLSKPERLQLLADQIFLLGSEDSREGALCAAVFLGRVKASEAVPFLIEVLERNSKTQESLAFRIQTSKALKRITGHDFGYQNVGAWKKWHASEVAATRGVEEPWKRDLRISMSRRVSFEFKQKPVEECLAALRNMVHITMIVDPRVLKGGGPRITLRATEMPFELAFKWTLRLADLDYVLKDRAVFIGSRESMVGDVDLRIYDVSDLKVVRDDFPAARFGDQKEEKKPLTTVQSNPKEIATMIRKRVKPESWNPKLGTTIEARGGRLVVMQRPKVHALINKLLDALRAAQKQARSNSSGMVLEIYDIRDLAGPDSKKLVLKDGMSGTGVFTGESGKEWSLEKWTAVGLAKEIRERLLAKEFALEGASISAEGGKFVVMQTPKGHARIKEILRALRTSAKNRKEEGVKNSDKDPAAFEEKAPQQKLEKLNIQLLSAELLLKSAQQFALPEARRAELKRAGDAFERARQLAKWTPGKGDLKDQELRIRTGLSDVNRLQKEIRTSNHEDKTQEQKRALKQYENDRTRALVDQATALIETEKFEQADNLLSKILEGDPKNKEADALKRSIAHRPAVKEMAARKAQVLLDEAKGLFHVKQYARALTRVGEALALKPDLAEAKLMRTMLIAEMNLLETLPDYPRQWDQLKKRKEKDGFDEASKPHRSSEKKGLRPDPNEPVAKVKRAVAHLDARRGRVQTLVAKMKGHQTLRGKKGKERELNVAFIGNSVGQFRLQLKRKSNVLLDVACMDSEVSLWLPRKNRFFKGPVRDAEDPSGMLLPLLIQAGYTMDLFLPSCWSRRAVERRHKTEQGKSTILVMERPGRFRKLARRFVLHPERRICEFMEFFFEGKVAGHIQFEQYRFPARKDSGSQQCPLVVAYPGRVTLAVPGGEKKFHLEVENVLFNTPIPSEKFRLTVPEKVRVRKLSEAFGNSGLFGE